MPDGTTITEEHLQEERRTIETLLGGTVGGGIIAIAGVVLAIIGLAGVYPQWLLAVATIAVGISFLIEGAAIASRLSELVHESTRGRVEMGELGSGVTGETLAGIAGIVLGVLGALNVYPAILLPVAAIVYGAGLILGAGANVRINELIVVHREDEARARYAIRQAVLAMTGLQVFIGLAAATLGIIALASSYPITLSLGGHAGCFRGIRAQRQRHRGPAADGPASVSWRRRVENRAVHLEQGCAGESAPNGRPCHFGPFPLPASREAAYLDPSRTSTTPCRGTSTEKWLSNSPKSLLPPEVADALLAWHVQQGPIDVDLARKVREIE